MICAKSEQVRISIVINADFDCDFDFEENVGNIKDLDHDEVIR